MNEIVYLLVMVPSDEPVQTETEVRELLSERWKGFAQVQLLGGEDRAVKELWRAQQRILARRQQESRSGG